MVKSMTGYGRAREMRSGRDITVEVRSVNNRYLDCTVKLPRAYIFAEDAIKTRVQKAISRGKVDVFVTIDTSAADVAVVQVNEGLAKGYYDALTLLKERFTLPGEITPEEANRLGRELALRFTKGRYAFIVATHTDRAHIHNHIIYNSTSIDGSRKFKNFWLSSFALQKISDLICLENGLSVITPRPYRERTKRTEYPHRMKNRDVLQQDIDAILQKSPESFDALLQELQTLGYEIKYGKHISVKGKNQSRFIRLSSLENGYTETDLRAYFLSQQVPKAKGKHLFPPQNRAVNLLIDVQSKLQPGNPPM